MRVGAFGVVAGMLLAVSLLASCDVKRPQGVLSDTQMEQVLYDYHLAKAMAEELSHDESYRRTLYRDGVFLKHGITEAEFDSSMVWFTRNPDCLAQIYERVNRRLKSERDGVNHLIALRDNEVRELPSGDSVQVWTPYQRQLLSGMPMGCKVDFLITADTTFHERDSVVFAVRYRYLNGTPDSLYSAFMSLSMRFKNDSILSVNRSLRADTLEWTELSLYSDTLGEITKVSGFVYFPHSRPGLRLRIEEMEVMRYHAKDSLRLKALEESMGKKVGKEQEVKEKAVEDQPQEEVKPAQTEAPMSQTERLRQRSLNRRPEQKSTAQPPSKNAAQPVRKSTTQPVPKNAAQPDHSKNLSSPKPAAKRVGQPVIKRDRPQNNALLKPLEE